MSELALFIGPPADRKKDCTAVSRFLLENGRKIIIGGTTVSIFEKCTGYKSTVNLSTAADGLPPYGELDGISVTEGYLTLCRVNETFYSCVDCLDAAGIIKEAIRTSKQIKIYLGSGFNPINGTDKKPVITEFIKNINQSGVRTEIVNY